MPRLNRFGKRGEKDPLLDVKSEKERTHILETFAAIERYVMMALIANGMLQLLSLKYSSIVEKSSFCWQRTNTGSVVSETTMSRFLRRDFFMWFHKQAHLPILQIIRSRIELNDDSDLSSVA
jgi:hypothetical protein